MEVEDILVADCFAARHGDAEVVLRSFLNDVGMELLYSKNPRIRTWVLKPVRLKFSF